MSLAHEITKALKEKCPNCGKKAKATHIIVSGKNKAVMQFYCDCGVSWGKNISCEIEVSEIG